MNLPDALRKALAALRAEERAVILSTSRCKYRLAPNDQHTRGYLVWRSLRYNDEWLPWNTVESFDVDDILTDKWSVH